jgi:CelD/BcsL family acetyltransferase involved in cellulose biosynthesis
VVPSHIHSQKEKSIFKKRRRKKKRKKEKKKEIEGQVSLNVMKPSFTEFGNS